MKKRKQRLQDGDDVGESSDAIDDYGDESIASSDSESESESDESDYGNFDENEVVSDDEVDEDTYQKVIQSAGLRSKKKARVSEVTTKPLERKGKLTLRSLVDRLDATGATKTTRKRLGKLLPSIDSAAQEERGKSTAPAPISAPLTEQERSRISRRVAYDETKKQLKKWQPVVHFHRHAEALHFPLDPPATTGHGTSSASLVHKFEANTPLELQVESVLKEAGISQKDILKYEGRDGEHAHDRERDEFGFEAPEGEDMGERREALAAAEEKRRRGQMAKLRSLMFHESIKRRQQKRIKSKKYHRLLKKEKERAQGKGQSIEELERLDPEAAKEARMKIEEDRARERMGLRHSVGGKKMRDTLRRGARYGGGNEDIHEMLTTREELKRKIFEAGGSDDSESESGSGEGESEGEGEGVDHLELHSRGTIQAAGISVDDRDMGKKSKSKNDDDESKSGVPKKGLFSLQFMQRAMQKKRDEAEKLAEEIERIEEEEFEGMNESESERDEGEGEDEFKGHTRPSDTAVAAADAAISGDSSARVHRARVSAPVSLSGTSSAVVEADTAPRMPYVERSEAQAMSSDEDDAMEEEEEKEGEGGEGDGEGEGNIGLGANPWVQPITANTDLHARSGRRRFGKNGKVLAGKSGNADSGVGSAIHIGQDDTSIVLAGIGIGKKVEGEEEGEKEHEYAAKLLEDDDSDDDDDDEQRQRAIIREAFSEDPGVVEEWEETKRSVLAEEGVGSGGPEKAVAGWGDWAGMGVKKTRKQKMKEKRDKKKAAEMAEEQRKARRDGRASHVIISEKKDKKAAKYLVSNVPHGFRDERHFVGSSSRPIGSEYSSLSKHDRLVRPKISVTAGEVIEPPKLTKQYKTAHQAETLAKARSRAQKQSQKTKT